MVAAHDHRCRRSRATLTASDRMKTRGYSRLAFQLLYTFVRTLPADTLDVRSIVSIIIAE